jgi:hypothetical protein
VPATPNDGPLGRRDYDNRPSIRKLESAVRAASKQSEAASRQSEQAKQLAEKTALDVGTLLGHVQALRELTETNVRALVSQGDETNRVVHSIDGNQKIANGRLAKHDEIIVAITNDIAAVRADIAADRASEANAKARRDGMLVAPRVVITVVRTVGVTKIAGFVLLTLTVLLAGTQLGTIVQGLHTFLKPWLGG